MNDRTNKRNVSAKKNEEKPLFLEMSMHLCEKAHITPKKGNILIIFLVNTLIKCEIAFVCKIPIHIVYIDIVPAIYALDT